MVGRGAAGWVASVRSCLPDRRQEASAFRYGTSSVAGVASTLRDADPILYRYVVKPRLDIRLLGPPEVLVSGAPLVVDTRKAVAILALLAAEGRPFARDELAALLWPDADDAAARGALRRTLSTLRAAIGDGPLLIDRGRVDLDRDQVRVDLADLEAAARSGDRAALAAAAALARGPFLAGFNLRDSAAFDDWRAARAATAERSMLSVFDRLATSAAQDGDLPAAIEAASRRLDLDPLDEGGHVRLMDLFASAGDRSAAIRQYRACVAVLERELGVAPLASTTERYHAIRDAPEVTPPPAPPAVAPTPIPVRTLDARPLVGRDALLEAALAAHARTADGTGVVVAIVGEAGIGKTRLGEAVTDELRARGATILATRAYPGERAVAYAPIVELLRSSLAEPDATARAAGMAPAVRADLARLLPAIAPAGADAPALSGPGAHARLVFAIADGLVALTSGPTPGVIWIDDLQWADGATLEALEHLVRRLSGNPLIVLLAWRAEEIGDDVRAVIDRLGAPPAVTLPLSRLDRDEVAGLVAATVGEGVADADIVDRLALASEGLPLYVTEALASGSPSLGSMPNGVRAVLRERLASVGETTGQVLTAAAVIGRSFDLVTVRHTSGRSELETVDALDEALARGLIREQGAGFDFAHGALRDLAYESTSLARRRLLHRRTADALRLDLSGAGRDDLARRVLIAAHERDGGRTAEAAEAFLLAGERAAEVFANREAIEYLESALALGHPDARSIHAAVGRLRTRLGDYAAAIEALESAASMAGADALPGLERSLAAVHVRRGDLVAAERHLAAAIGSAPGDAAFAARVLADLSVVRRRSGDAAGALAAASEGLAAAMAVGDGAGDMAGIGAAQRMLGMIALDAGDHQAAREAAADALTAAEQDPDPTARIAALTGLAMAESAAGLLPDALRHGDQAVEACRRIGDRHLEAAVENHLADLLHEAGRDGEAMEHLRRAVAAFAEVGGDPADPDPGIWMLSAS